MGCCCSKSSSDDESELQQTLISSDIQSTSQYEEHQEYMNSTNYEESVNIASINAKRMDDEIEKQMHKENLSYIIYQNSILPNYNEFQ